MTAKQAKIVNEKGTIISSEKKRFVLVNHHIRTCMICNKRRHHKARFSNGYEGVEACAKCCFLLIIRQIGSKPLTLKDNLPKAVKRK